jgi:multidrug efflux pump subunit AcrA (membrane-fusion protein)
MTVTTENEQPVADDPPPNAPSPVRQNTAGPGICNALAELVEMHGNRAATYRESLKRIGSYFRSPYAAVRVTLRSNVIHEQFDPQAAGGQLWRRVVEDALLDCQTNNLPLARRFRIEGHGDEAAVLAVPLRGESGNPKGAMALVARSEGIAYTKRCLGELEALVTLIGRQPSRNAGAPRSREQDEDALKRAVVKASDFESLHELAFAMTNSLKNKFGCSQVALGKVENNRVYTLSISGLDDTYPRSPGVQHAQRAMEECLDCGETICCQPADRWAHQRAASGHLLHQRWREFMGGAPVASIPMFAAEQCIAVLAITRPTDKPFSDSELREIEKTVTPFAPAIKLISKADRSLRRHAVDAVGGVVRWLLAPHSHGRKLTAVAVLLLAAVFFFVNIQYHVSLPCAVEPTETRRVSSPFDGTIATCLVDVGDHVVAGQLLLRLDTGELLLQIDQAESELKAAELKLNQSLVGGDVQAAAMAGAECNVIRSRLKLARHRLRETEIVAPCDGTIVAGEVARRIGEVVQMGEPLLEFVPDGDWAIELFAPESTIAELDVGMSGEFSSNARPESMIGCVIETIHPKAEARDGNTVYVIEGRMERNPDWLRSGMQGVAHVHVGKRPIWWIACHRLIDYAHRIFWF